MENWNKFLTEQKVSAVLDDLLSKTHASGRKIPQGFSEVTEDVSTSAMEIAKQITPSVIRKVISKYESVGQIDVSKISDPRELAVVNSLILFTAGNVESVRDPEKFSDEDAEALGSPIMGHGYGAASYVDSTRKNYKDDKRVSQAYRDKIRRGTHLPPYLFKPTKELYRIANYVLIQCGTMTGVSRKGGAEIYRGMSLPEQIHANLKVGSTFINKMISSWTTDKKMGEEYAGHSSEGKWCLFIIKNPKHGIDISPLSAYDHEDEYILGKPVTITDIKTEDLSRFGLSIRTYYICED